MTPAEFSRPVRLDTIGTAVRSIAIEADAAERRALARRFGLIAIDALSAEAGVSRDGGTILVSGRVRGRVVQRCVATDAAIAEDIDTPFSLRFVSADQHSGEEIELSADDCDLLIHDGQAIDLGDVAAETLALALDPFPRAADADAVLKAAGVLDESETGPFAGLKALRDRLG